MCLVSVSVVRSVLVRFMSALVVRIALGAGLTTSGSAIALQSSSPAIAQPLAPVVIVAAQNGENDSRAAKSGGQEPPGFAGPGLGWG